VAEYVGHRLGQPSTALTPQTIAHATLGVALSAYQHWLDHPEQDLSGLLDAAMRELALAHTAQ
jgi:TetR/AcrR family transcriptional regulator, regulator of mycofactocin system